MMRARSATDARLIEALETALESSERDRSGLLRVERAARAVVEAASPYVIQEAPAWRELREALSRVV